ncbi:alpha/beta hydrolase family protein [Sphingobium boeckii]|uniref:Acetyl esterase/lipase n=1 Tax=Sphingobium boeckii TaxID=1082345 RepID=A0A7W9EFS3_9SPHN|nr:alpha/beta hydrolase [Sphingobium boeckii]MBB5686016.1 acetyl esterase/lipase [Sphingobium boeckii]
MTQAPLLNWSDLLARPVPEADRKIAYGAGDLQFVDLWLPETRGPHPVVLMIHGGCWQSDVADRTIMNWIAADLRGRGIAVWNVEYRGVDRPGGGYPGTFLDVAAAADLLAKDGPAIGLKTDRIVAVGHSAGGHLALWLANRAALPKNSVLRGAAPAPIAAALSQGGLPDLQFSSNTVGHGCGTEGAKAMAGAPSAARPDVYADTSPIAMKPGVARQISVNATQDRIAPPGYAQAYGDALAAKGVTVDVVTIKDEGHVELIAPESAAWAETVRLIQQALQQ